MKTNKLLILLGTLLTTCTCVVVYLTRQNRLFKNVEEDEVLNMLFVNADVLTASVPYKYVREIEKNANRYFNEYPLLNYICFDANDNCIWAEDVDNGDLYSLPFK